jgi:hypothetical protein
VTELASQAGSQEISSLKIKGILFKKFLSMYVMDKLIWVGVLQELAAECSMEQFTSSY